MTPAPDPLEMRAREHLGRQIKHAAAAGEIGPAMVLAGRAEEVAIAAMLAFADEQVAAERERCAGIAAKVAGEAVKNASQCGDTLGGTMAFAAHQMVCHEATQIATAIRENRHEG